MARTPILSSQAKPIIGVCFVALFAAIPAARAEQYRIDSNGRITVTGTADVFAALSPDGTRIVVGSGTTARVYNALTLKPVSEEMEHGQVIKRVAFDGTGTRVLTVSRKYARVWESGTGNRLSPALHHGPAAYLREAALSPDGKRLMTVAAQPARSVMFQGEGIETTPVNEPPPKVTPERGEVRVWDITTGELDLALPHQTYVAAARFSPDGRRIVTMTISLMGVACLWDAATGKLVGEPKRDALATTGESIWFSADSSRYAIGGWYEVTVHSTENGKLIRRIDECATHCLPTSIALSPDGKTVYMTDQGTDAQSWNVDTGEPVAGPLKHLGEMNGVWFSPDGKRMLVSGYDWCGGGIWDCAAGKVLWEPPTHQGVFTAAVFMPDGLIRTVKPALHGVEVFEIRFIP